MKVSIITIISQANYGAILQAFALCKHVETLGYEVELVNYTPDHRTAGTLKYLYYKVWMSVIGRRRRKLRNFIVSNVHMTRETYRTFDHLRKNPPGADIYLVGSDQVWNSEIYQDGLQPAFFLQFTAGKKISYASSIGKDLISSEELAQIRDYLNDFYAISVREDSARRLLQEAGVQNVVQVLDPVFLLEKMQYEALAKQSELGKYLLIYGFEANECLSSVARAVAERLGIRVVELGFAFKRFDSDYFLRNLGAEEFLGLIAGAEYVVTSSFHGTAFSLIFQKNFLSVAPSKRRKRIDSILNIVGLRDRLIADFNDFKYDKAIQPINYIQPTIKLKKEIAKSKQYIAYSLNGLISEQIY